VGEKWNIARANQLLRAALAEIDELADKLSPARAEALLDEFEHDISGAFLLQDMSAVTAHCETYARRFRELGEEKD
jgi:succinate dehydrogenase/fumarate reductase flavoprotein subunit